MTDGVAVYVHWPYCARICPYCDFNVVRARSRTDEQAALVQAIVADLKAQAERIGPRPLASIFFGGGTPSLMRAADVAAVVDAAHLAFPPSDPVEITLEANPTDAEAGHFAALRAAGIQRLSLGVQSLDDRDLAFLGRNHDAREAERAIAEATRRFDRLSVDLIYALPDQTVSEWRALLTRAIGLGFGHVSPYQLTVEPTTAFGRAARRGVLVPPDADRAADLYEATQATLSQAGFEAYEVSNHARGPAARSAHNLHVWRGGDYLGLGPGAHGRLTLDGARTATVAQRRIADYVAGVAAGQPWSKAQPLDARDADEERLLLGLRTTEGVALSLIHRLGLDATNGPLGDLLDEGFVHIRGDRLSTTDRGRPLLDAVLKTLLV